MLSLGAIVFPIIYMWRLSGGSDMLACLWPEEAEDPEAVTIANPAATTSTDKKKGKGKGKGEDKDPAATTSMTYEEELRD